MAEVAGDQLVLQLPVSDETDFDALIGIENELSLLFMESRSARVERHDMGHGKFNVFIRSNESPLAFLGRMRAFLEFHGVLEKAIIAKRVANGESYEVMWPTEFRGTFEV